MEPLPLGDPSAKEATRIESEPRDTGAAIDLADVLIAGIRRHDGARLVTRDDHFDRVSDLAVETY